MTAVATARSSFRPRMTDRRAWVLGAIVGVSLGCAGAKPKPNVWFDACCQTCEAGHCDDCTAAKRDCGEARKAQCMIHADMWMCRPPPETRH